jgi:hypothetical protein
MAAKSSLLAIDTNVLLDLAEDLEDVIDAFEVIEKRLPNVSFLVPPSVLDELAFLADFGESAEIREKARKAFQKLHRDARFRPILELPFGQALAEELAQDLRTRGILPVEEVHDSFIVVEAALLNCGLLLSSDAHLRAIDHEQLTFVLHPHDLIAPVIATPREIVRKFFR